MAVCDDREDIISMCLTVLTMLMEDYGIDYANIGRLEVGTETLLDKSKSVKSVLMQLFQEKGNTDIEGVDTTNACYGGTNALFNTINWVESSSWDGRFGLVLAGDIAVYKSGPARPTGGAGVVAMLIGPNAPLVFDSGLRVSHMEHVWDFYKPDMHSEYPEVDGPLSNQCYIRALDTCYQRYVERYTRNLAKTETHIVPTDIADYFCFHSPYSKLVQKSFARMFLCDFVRNRSDPQFDGLAEKHGKLTLESSFGDRHVEKAFMAYTKDHFDQCVRPSLLCGKQLGNTYCASLYCGLVSLISQVPSDELQGKRILMFSYGSGLASSMFSLSVTGPTTQMATLLNLEERLASRTVVSPQQFDRIMHLREETHNRKDYSPMSPVDSAGFFPGTYVLQGVDEKYRRSYEKYEEIK